MAVRRTINKDGERGITAFFTCDETGLQAAIGVPGAKVDDLSKESGRFFDFAKKALDSMGLSNNWRAATDEEAAEKAGDDGITLLPSD